MKYAICQQCRGEGAYKRPIQNLATHDGYLCVRGRVDMDLARELNRYWLEREKHLSQEQGESR
jgi:hypothetical protein